MTTEPKLPRSDREDVMARNVSINAATVKSHDRLVEDLERIGVRIKKPRFNIEHPLGGDRLRFSNRAKRQGH